MSTKTTWIWGYFSILKWKSNEPWKTNCIFVTHDVMCSPDLRPSLPWLLKRGCAIVLWGEQVAETYTSRSGGCFGTTSPLLLSSEHFTSCVVASFRAYWIEPVEEICLFRFTRDVSFGFGSTAFIRSPHLRSRARGGFHQWLDWTHTCTLCHLHPWDPLGNIHLLLQNHLNFQRMEVVQYILLLLALFSYAVNIFV